MDATAPTPSPRNRYSRELLLNQIWQSANFLAKALFLLLLTPLMLDRWGAEQYGLFALASSLLVSMALLDGGVRALTRVRMAAALKAEDDGAFRHAFGEGLVTFSSVVIVACAAGLALMATGLPAEWLRLPAGGTVTLATTAVMTGLFLITVLALEPLAARGNLSTMKAANTWGAVSAFPLCGLAVWFGAGVLPTVVLYSLCLIIPNIVVALKHRMHRLFPWHEGSLLHPLVILRTLRAGVWYYLTTVSLIVKTHALTFVVSAMAGPAEAGLFYILLRVTEIVGNVGATASETSLASLASAADKPERARSFRQSWQYVSVFCLHGTITLVLLGESLLRLWLTGDHQIVPGLGLAMAIFGLAGAVSRVVVNAAMGLDTVKTAALGNVVEAVVNIACAAIGYHLAGMPGLMILGSVGLLAMLPAAREVARRCGESLATAYAKPLGVLLPGLALAALVQFGAWLSNAAILWFGGLGVAGVIALFQLRRLHRGIA